MPEQHPLSQLIVDQIPFSKTSASLLNTFLLRDQESTDELRVILLYCNVYPKFSNVQRTNERLISFKTELNDEIDRLRLKIAEIERLNILLNSLDDAHLMDPVLGKRLINTFGRDIRMRESSDLNRLSRLGLKRLPFRRVRYALLLRNGNIRVFNTSLDVPAHKHCSEFIKRLSLMTNQQPGRIHTLELPYQLAGDQRITWVYEKRYIKNPPVRNLIRYRTVDRALLTMLRTENGWVQNE